MNNPISQRGKMYEVDALVIGSGLAGLHYCLQLLKIHPKTSIGLVSKAALNECNSRYAQGGIASVYLPTDSLDAHIDDTLRAGDGLCYRPSVEYIIGQGPQAIRELQDYAIDFNTAENGDYILAQEGGHSHRRIFNCGDKTGFNVIEAIVSQVRQSPQIQLFEHHVAVNLITHYQLHKPKDRGEVYGAYILDTTTNKIHTVLARTVILATGGAGKTFRYTSNPMVATGDGVAMAYRAGARIGNMEFYQFHPTLLYHHRVNNFLISEAVRGEGAHLIHPDTGERFMKHYAPEAMELATRDVVARAIFNEIEHSDQNFVYLDITHQPKSFLKKQFPQIYSTLESIGIDMSQDKIPVVPAAHYQCGGILTDMHGQTDLKRLFAIGEVAFTGLHGANRLASNSLLEATVMASSAAQASIKCLQSPLDSSIHISTWDSPAEINPRRASQINAHWRSLRGEMTSYAGIVRTEAGLQDLLQFIMMRNKIIEEYYWKLCITRDFIELRNIIMNAELIVRAALARRESRGGHYREDHPYKTSPALEGISRMESSQDPFI